MDIHFVAGFAAISTDVEAGHTFYREVLGLPLEIVNGDYIAVDGFAGTKHLGIWPLQYAAESCFGTPQWPSEIPIPQASIEFEVADVEVVATLPMGSTVPAADVDAVGRRPRSPCIPRRR